MGKDIRGQGAKGRSYIVDIIQIAAPCMGEYILGHGAKGVFFIRAHIGRIKYIIRAWVASIDINLADINGWRTSASG